MSAIHYDLFSWRDLGVIASELAAKLESLVPERHRVDLDARLASLLRELSARIQPEPYRPGRPEYLLRRHGPKMLARAYTLQAEMALRNERVRILNSAADMVLGSDARHWQSMRLLEDVQKPSMPQTSDEGMRAMLEIFQRVAIERGLAGLKKEDEE